jgi:hypothetical protein
VITDYTLMAPTLVRAPFNRAGWVFEEKADGWRMLAYKDGAHVRLVSRNGVDHTRRFADIAAAVAKLSARTLVLDGEDQAGEDLRHRTRFESRDRISWPRVHAEARALHVARVVTFPSYRSTRARLPRRPGGHRIVVTGVYTVIDGHELMSDTRVPKTDVRDPFRGPFRCIAA